MLMETEGAAPILESLRSILLSLDTNTSIGSIPSLNDVQIPKEVGDWLKQVRSHLEGFVGKEKETQLRLVNFERMMKQSEHRMKTQESRAEQLESELATAQQLISSLQGEKGKESGSLTELRRQLESCQADLGLMQGKMERSEVEKLELTRVLERKQTEMDSLNDQLESLIKKQSQNRQDLLQREAAIEDLRRQLSGAQLEANSSVQQGETARKQAEWASAELERAIAELRDYRKQKVEEVSSLRAELETAQGSSMVLEKQICQLRTTLEERDSKIEQLLQQLLQSREESAEKERHFMEEMDAKSKIAGVFETSSEEASARIRELEGQLEETMEAMRSVDERIAEIQETHQDAVAQLQKAISEKDALIESLKSQVAASEGTGSFSSNAGAALQTVRSGQSFSQVYSELTQARTSLLEASQENERLKSCLRDICEDIEARLPSIQADREENARLKAAVSSLSERMSSLSQERESLQSQLNSAISGKEHLVKEAKALELQVADLGQQVQSLLLQQDSSIDIDSTETIDSNKIITSRLVSVKNVAELQVRNQELLRVVRDLASRAESAESQIRLLQDGSNVQPQLEAALKEIAQLREARAKQSAMVENLLSNSRSHAALPPSRPAVDLTAESEDGRSVVGSEMYDPQLTLRLEEARSECMSVKSALAKAQAKAEFTQERLELLKSNYDSCRTELEQTRSLQSEQSKSLVRVQSELQSMLTEVMNAREAARKAESELSMLKTTLSVAQATERRLAAEKDGLQEEKQKLASLLSGLQGMIAESEANGQSLRERLTTQVESLERDLQVTRRRLEETVEGHRLETAALGRENRELHEKVNRLYEDLSKQKESHVTHMATSTLREEPAQIEQIEKFKALAHANERSLLEVSQSYDEYRSQAESRLQELESLVNDLRNQLTEANESHAATESAWNEEKAGLGKRLADLSDVEAMMKEHAGLRAEDISRLHTLLQETQAALETEKAAHLADSEQLLASQTQLRTAQSQLDSLNSALGQAQNTLAQREAELSERIKDAESAKERAIARSAELETLLQGKLNPEFTTSEGGDEAVVGYLRRQKDSLYLDLQNMQQDNRRLESQLDQTKALLEEARARLVEAQEGNQWQAQMAAEYEQLQARLASLGSLKEANVELSGRVDQLVARLQAAEVEGRRLATENESLSLCVREAAASESIHSEHIRVLTSDRDAWKQRCTTQGISLESEETIIKLQEENTRLLEKEQQLVNRAEHLENKCKAVLMQTQTIKNQRDELKAKLAEMQSNEAVEAELATLKQQLEEHQKVVETLRAEKNELALKLGQYNNALKKLTPVQQELTKVREENAALSARLKQAESTPSGAAAGSGMDDLKREHEMHKTLLVSQWQARVNKLQTQVDALQNQVKQQQELDESLHQSKRAKQEEVPHPVQTPVVVQEPVQTSIVVETPILVEAPKAAEHVEILDSDMVEMEDVEELDDTYHDEDEDMEYEVEEVEDDEDYVDETAEEAGEEAGEAVEAAGLEPPHNEHQEEMQEVTIETPDVLHAVQPDLTPTTTEAFDFDQFIIDQDLDMKPVETKPKVINLPVTSVPTHTVLSTNAPVSRTIQLPTSTVSTFTPAPTTSVSGTTTTSAAPAAPKSRMIDLSQTGKRPLVLPTEPSTVPTPASGTGPGDKPEQKQKRDKTAMRGRGKKFLKRGGGGHGGNAGSAPNL